MRGWVPGQWGSSGAVFEAAHKWLLALVIDLPHDSVSGGTMDSCQQGGLPSSRCCLKRALPACGFHIPHFPGLSQGFLYQALLHEAKGKNYVWIFEHFLEKEWFAMTVKSLKTTGLSWLWTFCSVLVQTRYQRDWLYRFLRVLRLLPGPWAGILDVIRSVFSYLHRKVYLHRWEERAPKMPFRKEQRMKSMFMWKNHHCSFLEPEFTIKASCCIRRELKT